MDIVLNLTTESVAQMATVQPVCVSPQMTIRQVLELLLERRTGSLLVTEAGRLVGIFTERDALRLMAENCDLDTPMAEVMVRDPVVIGADESVATAIRKMSGGGYRRLPVVDADGCPVGMVKVSSIVHYLVEHFPKTVYNQPPVSHVVMQEREGA